MNLVDTHAHLDMLKKSTPAQAVDAAIRQGVQYIINIGSSLEASKQAKALSEVFDNVYSAAGIHPHHAENYSQSQENSLREIIESSTKIVAVGEAGLDYFRNTSPKKDQIRAFESQIGLALEYNLPLVIHDRDAHQDILQVLSSYAGQDGFKAVVHCYSGDSDLALKLIEQGLFISFTGVLTFPNAGKVAEAAKVIPMDRIFLETDTPFLAPQAKRGQENQPAYVTYIAEKLAEIKNLSLEEVANITTRNAIDFFGLGKI
ncbi:MAG: TatD family hydrolase [Actinomycetota bacterium]|nr:TatD family hydrolase [Actinomycetota bacterium]